MAITEAQRAARATVRHGVPFNDYAAIDAVNHSLGQGDYRRDIGADENGKLVDLTH